MRALIKIWALVLCACLLVLLSGCSREPEATTVTTTGPTEPQMTAEEKYLLGRESIDQAGNWILSYTVDEKRTVGQDVYSRTVSGKASFSKLHQTDMIAVVEEERTYGSFACSYAEVYCDGQAYVQAIGSRFKNTMEPEVFIDRQLPAILLDSGLYQTLTQEVKENSTVITFKDAKAMEAWLGAEDGQIISASGTATLDSTGLLQETTYQVVYMLGQTRYEYSATVRVSAPKTLDLGGTHHEHIKGSVALENLDVPQMLLQVVGDVYASGQIRCEAKETIYSEAIPMSHTQSSTYTISGFGEELNAQAKHETTLSDYRGEITSESWSEYFRNGRYSTSKNGAGIVSATAEQVRQYMEDAILSALMAPIFVRNGSVQKDANYYRLEMTGNRQYIVAMMENIGGFLQVDLDNQATQSNTLSAGGYLTIHKETGLPVSMGLYLEREHTINDIPYRLTYQLDHTLELSGTK